LEISIQQLLLLSLFTFMVWGPWLVDRYRGRDREQRGLLELIERVRPAMKEAREALALLDDEYPEWLCETAVTSLNGESLTEAHALGQRRAELLSLLDRVAADHESALAKAATWRWWTSRAERARAKSVLDETWSGEGGVALRSAALLPDLEHEVGAMQERVRDLRAASEEAGDWVDRVHIQLERADIALESMRDKDREIRPLENALAELRYAAESSCAEAACDPVGGRASLRMRHDQAAALADRCEAVRDAIEHRSKKLQTRISEIDAALTALRDEGFRVREPGFEPDVMRRGLSDALDAIDRHVSFGDGDAALVASRSALADADLLFELISRWSRWRDVASNRVGSQVGRVQELRARLPSAEQQLERLELRVAVTITVPLRRRLLSVEADLTHGLACLRLARTASGDVARYLAAGELLRRAQASFDRVRDTFLEIEQKPEQLADARREAEVAFRGAAERIARLDEIAGEPGVGLAPETVELQRNVEALYRAMRRDALMQKPDWTDLKARAQKLDALSDAAVDRALADREAAEDATAALRELRDDHDRLRVWLGTHADKPAATSRLDAALAAADEARELMRSRPITWWKVRHALADARRLFTEAVHLSPEPFDVRESARAAVSLAARALQEADRSYGFRVRPDLQQARFALEDAREALASSRHVEAELQASRATGRALQARHHALSRVAEVRESRALADMRRTERHAEKQRVRAVTLVPSAERADDDSCDVAFGTTTGFSSFGRPSAER
jgi:hypothetical protein